MLRTVFLWVNLQEFGARCCSDSTDVHGLGQANAADDGDASLLTVPSVANTLGKRIANTGSARLVDRMSIEARRDLLASSGSRPLDLDTRYRGG